MNCVQLIGRIANDVELRRTGGGQVPVASFRLAVSRRQTADQRASGAMQETDFVPVVVDLG